MNCARRPWCNLSPGLVSWGTPFPVPPVNQPAHVLVTHAGAFHSDEIMALVLLETFYLLRPLRMDLLSNDQAHALIAEGKQPDMPAMVRADGLEDHRTPTWVIRSRTPELLQAAVASPTTFVVDVGGVYDTDALNFDHHQGSMTDAWEDGTPLSSTGLVWRWLKQRGLLTLSDAEQLELEETLIRPLDAHDNGCAEFDAATVCEGYNRLGSDVEVQVEQFQKALTYLREVWANHRFQAVARAEARPVLTQAWEAARERGDRFVVLEDGLAYPDGTGLLKAISNDEALMLAIPGKGKKISVISLSGDTRFSVKCPLPEAWRGQMDFDAELDGGKTVRMAFAHKTGFMGVVLGELGDAIAVCRHIEARYPHAWTPRRRGATLG